MLSQHFSSQYYNRQILAKYFFFQQTIFAFSKFVVQETLARWPKPLQNNNAWRSKGPSGRRIKVPNFDQIFSHIFYYFKKTDLMSFANFYFGQGTLKLQILQKYFAKPVCQSYLTHIRCHDQTLVVGLNFGNSCTKQVKNFWSRQIHV